MREHSRCFALDQGPLIHTELLQLQEDDHVLFFNFHHIIINGWSVTVFLEELATVYTALVEQIPSPLAPFAVQYADYALWQREYLRTETLEKLLIYWQRQMYGAPSPVSLPTGRPRPVPFSYRGAFHCFSLSSDVYVALSKLSRQENCTLFMVLLTAVQMLLARANRQDDIAIGMPSAH